MGFLSILQKFYGAAILWCVDHLFWERPSKYCIVQFSACYSVDLDDIQWNEVANSTNRNFNNSWPLYLTFSNMIYLSQNIWFTENSKCQQFFFEKGAAKITQFFHIFKGPLIRNGWPYWYELWRILRDSCGLSEKCDFATFLEIAKVMSIWMSKLGQNSTAFKK